MLLFWSVESIEVTVASTRTDYVLIWCTEYRGHVVTIPSSQYVSDSGITTSKCILPVPVHHHHHRPTWASSDFTSSFHRFLGLSVFFGYSLLHNLLLYSFISHFTKTVYPDILFFTDFIFLYSIKSSFSMWSSLIIQPLTAAKRTPVQFSVNLNKSRSWPRFLTYSFINFNKTFVDRMNEITMWTTAFK